jgi:autotransporter translocation and assembly factor TamB
MDERQKRTYSGAAAAIALQYQAGPLLDSVRKKLKLETLNLVTGDTPDTAGVGFSKAVGDRLVVEYQQLFGTLPEERLDLRYRINRRLAFRARTSSTTGAGGDLLWEQRY